MTRNYLFAFLILVFAAAGSARAQQSSDHSEQSPASAKKSGVPPYHATPHSGSLPPTIDPKQFGDGVTQNIYSLAAQVNWKNQFQLSQGLLPGYPDGCAARDAKWPGYV